MAARHFGKVVERVRFPHEAPILDSASKGMPCACELASLSATQLSDMHLTLGGTFVL